MNLVLRNTVIFIIYLLLQVFVFNHFTLFGVATPHVFLLVLLMLPINTRFPFLLLIAFGMGLAVDVFSFNTFKGLHAFAAVLMMSLRLVWVNVFTNRFSYHGAEEYLLQVQPPIWYVQYMFPLILVHHLAYYFLEAFSFAHFPLTLLKAGTSALYTFAIVLILTLLFHKTSKR